MRSATRERIDRVWEQLFGDATDEVRLVEHRGPLAGYGGIYCLVRNSQVSVSVPESMITAVRDAGIDPENALDPGWWGDHLPGWTVLGPSVHAFADEAVAVAAEGLLIKQAAPDDLAGLRAAASAEDWGESGFAGDDVIVAWAAIDPDRRPVAAANLTPFNGMAADVGVLTALAARGRGSATAVAAVACGAAIERHGIARWRALVGNAASRRIAERLGFEEDCRQLAVRPPNRP